jgi:hypothetical protein
MSLIRKVVPVLVAIALLTSVYGGLNAGTAHAGPLTNCGNGYVQDGGAHVQVYDEYAQNLPQVMYGGNTRCYVANVLLATTIRGFYAHSEHFYRYLYWTGHYGQFWKVTGHFYGNLNSYYVTIVRGRWSITFYFRA